MTEEIRAALAAIEDNGRITPDRVVETARDPRSPLHPHFTWDDGEAAHKHRLSEARTLIRSVRVVIRNEHKVVKTVAYVRDPDSAPNQQGYVRIDRITTIDGARDAVLLELARVAGHLERARKVASALDLEDELDLLIAGTMRFQEKVRERV